MKFSRHVDIPPNALEWLLLCKSRKGMVTPKGYQKRWKKLRTRAGVYENWTQDCCRHTFASFLYARTQDRNEVKKALGHASEDVLNHYVNAAKQRREEAKVFFDFSPPESSENLQVQEDSA